MQSRCDLHSYFLKRERNFDILASTPLTFNASFQTMYSGQNREKQFKVEWDLFTRLSITRLSPLVSSIVFFFGFEWLWNNKSSEKVNKHMRGWEQCLERDFSFCFLARLIKTKEKNLTIKKFEQFNVKNWISLFLRKTFFKKSCRERAYITRDQHLNIFHLLCAIRLWTLQTKMNWNNCFDENKSIYMMKRHRSRINRWRETFKS